MYFIVDWYVTYHFYRIIYSKKFSYKFIHTVVGMQKKVLIIKNVDKSCPHVFQEF